jgi:serine/threonine-protein kinase
MQGDVKVCSSTLAFGSPMPVPGDVIADKYRIEAVLGRGGMSVVYRATHLQLDQQVAIKILSAEALLLPEYVVRLKREARAVSRIRSEHVVRVHDIGALPDGGVPYLVMECLSGLDLAAVLARRGPFPVPLAVDCILQACEALAEAHALGIIHRDLKPANLFLSEAVDGSPCVKVLDFGISRMSTRHGLSALTDPGTVLGTPSYMAPEQMEAAETVDARSDIWALGTILYELLVGKPPYTGESLPQIFMKIMRSRTPKPSSVRAGIPSGIDSIVGRCLAIEPEDRFQTVADLAWALSTMGAPHGRDSAERISRVFDKHAAEATPSGTLRSSVPPPVVNGIDRRSRRRGRWRARHVTAAIASAALFGAASVFGVLAARGAIEAGVAHAAVHAPSTAANSVADDGAVAISPIVRPAAGPAAMRGAALPSPIAQKDVAATTARRAALLAATGPARAARVTPAPAATDAGVPPPPPAARARAADPSDEAGEKPSPSSPPSEPD